MEQQRMSKDPDVKSVKGQLAELRLMLENRSPTSFDAKLDLKLDGLRDEIGLILPLLGPARRRCETCQGKGYVDGE